MKKQLSLILLSLLACLPLTAKRSPAAEVETSRALPARSPSSLYKKIKTRSVTSLINTTEVCFLEARSPEKFVYLYAPDECRVRHFTLAANMDGGIRLKKLTTMDWAANTKESQQFQGNQDGVFQTLMTSLHPKHQYHGKLLIDEIINGVPMWWRFKDHNDLKTLIANLQKHLSVDDSFEQKEKTLLYLSVQDTDETSLSEDELKFLDDHFTLVPSDDNEAKTFFIKSQRKMLNEIQMLEAHKPALVRETLMEKATRLLEEKLTNMNTKETLLAIAIIGGLYLLRENQKMAKKAAQA
jgi:hypothetical protein